MRIKNFIKLFVISCLLFVGTAHAQTGAKYSEQALLNAWEDNQRAQPTTKLFQKTKDKNIYNFETTLFPYKGKIVVHNILIHKDIVDYSWEYKAKEAAAIVGIVEAELIDAPERFTKTLRQSISVWKQQNKMMFFNETQKWMTASQWKELQETSKKPTEEPEDNTSVVYVKLLITLLIPILILLISLYFVRRNTDKYRKSHSEQLEQIINIQKEQNDLLKQILSKKE